MKQLCKKMYKHILSICIPAALIFIVWYKMGIFYSTNDDRCLTEMLAGLVTNEYEPHLIYVNYLLALPLSLLYRITTSVSWFGAFIIILYYLSYVFILEAIYSKTKNLLQEIVITAVIACFFFSHIYLIGQTTYTVIAAFAAIAGYCCLLLHDNQKFGLIFFIILEALAYLLRDQAMLMMQPIGLMVICLLIICSDFKLFKENLIKCCKLIGIVLSIIIISFLGNKLGHLDKDWKTFNDFNEARTVLCDYTDFPPYEDVKSILDKYDVSKATYEGFISYTILDWDISLECLSELADHANESYASSSTFDQTLNIYWEILFENETDYYDMNTIMIMTFFIALIYILLSGQFKTLLPLLGFVLAQGVVWFYLIYQGRYPARVTMPLMAGETLLLITLVFFTYTKEKKEKYLSYVRMAALLIACFMFGKTAYSCYQIQHKEIKHINENQEIFMHGLVDLTNYCNSHPENIYIVDTASLRWYCGDALQTDILEKRNYTFAGGWFSNSPCFIEKNKHYLGDTSDGFYFIVNQTPDENILTHPAIVYLSEKSSCSPILKDEFTVSHGGIYSVIYFEKPLKMTW